LEGVTMRRFAAVLVGIAALGSFAGCSSSSSSNASDTSTTVKAKAPSAWVGLWRSKLLSDYGPSQQAFLTAIQGGKVADVQTAAQKVAAGNVVLRTAIAAAGPAPKADQAAAAKLVKGLTTESSLISEVVKVCTGTNEKCQAAVTAYAENNTKKIIPAFTGLGAMS
jgi:hypothetical protein